VRIYHTFRKCLVVASAILMYISVVAEDSKAIRKDGAISPQWRTDLRTIDKDAPVRMLTGRREYAHLPEMRLHFTDNSTLAVSFVAHPEDRQTLAERGRSDSKLPMRLQAIFLDAQSGKVLATPNWPTPVRDARIVAARDGKFVTIVEKEVTLYGPDLAVLKTLTLPIAMKPTTSPTQETILFVGYKNAGPKSVNPKENRPEDLNSTWMQVNFDDLRVITSWDEPRTGPVATTDDTLAMVTCTYAYVCEPHLAVRKLGQPWINISPAKWGAWPVFLTDDLILLMLGSFDVLHPDGKVAFLLPSNEERIHWSTPCVPPCEVAPHGHGRAFFPGWKTTGALPSLDVSGHSVLKKLLVFDVAPQPHTLILDINGAKIQDIAYFAMSPDGSHLAILNNEIVYVFALPEPEAQ
jgi:hypothetical protein